MRLGLCTCSRDFLLGPIVYLNPDQSSCRFQGIGLQHQIRMTPLDQALVGSCEARSYIHPGSEPWATTLRQAVSWTPSDLRVLVCHTNLPMEPNTGRTSFRMPQMWLIFTMTRYPGQDIQMSSCGQGCHDHSRLTVRSSLWLLCRDCVPEP